MKRGQQPGVRAEEGRRKKEEGKRKKEKGRKERADDLADHGHLLASMTDTKLCQRINRRRPRPLRTWSTANSKGSVDSALGFFTTTW